MDQWLPPGGSEPLDAVYADLPPAGRDRWVAVNMVATLDGRVTVDGTSGPIGGAGDLAAFRALRAAVDVVLVGAATVRAEDYGPPKTPEPARRVRRARGQAERPAIAVVTSSLDLGPSQRLYSDPTWRPHVITHAAADPAAMAALRDRGATVVVAGGDRVDVAAAVDALAADGLGRILCEGGPGLNAQLLAAGLVDDVFATIAPMVAGNDGPGMVGAGLAGPIALTLLEGRVHDGEILLRYHVPKGDQR